MADISNYLNQIKTAIKGEDVRGAIHDAIEACYTDGNWNATTGMVDVMARRKIDQFLNQGTGQANEHQLWPEEGSDSTIYCAMSFQLSSDPSQYDVIRVYYKVVSTGNPQIFEFPASEFASGSSVIAGLYFEEEENPCSISGRRINIQPAGGTDPTAYVAYNVSRWNWNGTVTDTTNGTNNAWSSVVDGTSAEGYPAGQITKITGIKFADISSTVNEAIEDYMDEHGGGSSGGGSDTPITGLVNTENIADHAVTMDKTDFYYTVDTSVRPDWITLTHASNAVPRGSVTPEHYTDMFGAVTTKLSLVCELTQTGMDTYWGNTRIIRFSARTAAYSTQVRGVTSTVRTIYANSKYYGVIEIERENLMAAYNNHLADLSSYPIDTGLEIQFGNVAGKFTEDAVPVAYLGEVTYETLENDSGIQTVISQDFVKAVQAALGEMEPEDDTTTTGKVKAKLNGKVMLCLGDSYTAMMPTQLGAIASKYGMVLDNQGLASSAIRGTENDGIRPFWYRANTIVSDYTGSSGKTISGTAYTADDVAIITFMGGANDGFGVETFIGTGIHETDKTKIYGSCNYIFNLFLKTFTNAKMIVITQPANYNYVRANIVTSDEIARTLGFEDMAEANQMDDYQFSNYAMAQKEKAVYDTAWACGIPIVDMFHEYPSVLNPTNRSTYWQNDKLHPTSAGFQLIANAIDKKIVELVLG